MSHTPWEESILRSEVCRFPKHYGEMWYDVIASDLAYAEWILENVEDLDEDLFDAITWGVRNVPEKI